MTDKELVERLREKAEWARCNEWETPLCLADDLTAAADAIERLKSELTQEKIDSTNLIGELATVAAERDRYKAERDVLIEAVRGDCNYCEYDSDYQLNEKCEICSAYASEENAKGCFWELRGLEENT